MRVGRGDDTGGALVLSVEDVVFVGRTLGAIAATPPLPERCISSSFFIDRTPTHLASTTSRASWWTSTLPT